MRYNIASGIPQKNGNVLFVGYQRDNLAHLHHIAEEHGFEAQFITDLTRIESFKELEQIKAVFTDSRFIGFNSRYDWNKFREIIGANPLWIHISEDTRPNSIVEFMRKGLDDYIPAHEYNFKVENYLRKLTLFHAAKQEEIANAEQKTSLLRKKVEWSTYMDSLRKAWNDISGREAITNLQINLSQGAGFGLMLSLMEILGMEANSDGQIAVDAHLFDKIKQNTLYTRKLLEGLSEYVGIIDNSVNLERITIEQIERTIKQRVSLFQGSYAKKNMRLRVSETYDRRTISANADLVTKVVDELIVNALKYSRSDTDVNILTSIQNGYYTITVQSFPGDMSPIKNGRSSIEKLKLPFYRAHPPIEETVEMEKFVMGLGLPAIEQIASKMSGVFKLEIGTDYCGTSVEPCFLAYFMVPLV